MWYGITVDNTWPTRHKAVKATPVQRRSTIDDTEPTPKRFNTLRLLGKEDNFAVGSALVDNRRRWTNAKVTPIQHPAPAVGIMYGHCRKDVQPPNQDMVNRLAFYPAYTTRQKRRLGAGPAFAALAEHRPNKWLESCVCRATSILFIIVTLNIMLVKYCYYIIQI